MVERACYTCAHRYKTQVQEPCIHCRGWDEKSPSKWKERVRTCTSCKHRTLSGQTEPCKSCQGWKGENGCPGHEFQEPMYVRDNCYGLQVNTDEKQYRADYAKKRKRGKKNDE